MSQDSSQNWMTINTYENTPRFSRLGISASNVVLPVSARDFKHASRKKGSANRSSTSFRASRSNTYQNGVPSMLVSQASPDSTRTTSTSAASSRETPVLAALRRVLRAHPIWEPPLGVSSKSHSVHARILI